MALALRIEQLARERLGDTPALRIGRAPKRLLVYRTMEPFKGIKRHPLEVLCLGQQFVAYAVHPVTNRPYEWPEDSLADLDLTVPLRRGFQLPTCFTPTVAPSAMSVRRDSPRHMTVFPGGGSLARAR